MSPKKLKVGKYNELTLADKMAMIEEITVTNLDLRRLAISVSALNRKSST